MISLISLTRLPSPHQRATPVSDCPTVYLRPCAQAASAVCRLVVVCLRKPYVVLLCFRLASVALKYQFYSAVSSVVS